LTLTQRCQLEQKYDIFQKESDLHSKKVKRMRTASAIETNVAIKYQLVQQLLKEEVIVAQLGIELDAIEEAL
jgi:hypothetical protein